MSSPEPDPDHHSHGLSAVSGPRGQTLLPHGSVAGIRGLARKQEKRKKNIKSLINVTAFPLYMALLVTVIKEGDSFTFYATLLPMTSLAILLQTLVAVAVVCKNALSFDEDEDLESETARGMRQTRKVKRATFKMGLQLLTILSIVMNLAVQAFFTARVMKGESNETTKGT